MSDDIVQFIHARLTEDETGASAAARPAVIPDAGGVLLVTNLRIERDALTVQRRCIMIRAMLRHAEAGGQFEKDVMVRHYGWTESELEDHPLIHARMYRDIAAYWNTHPDYQQSWRPSGPASSTPGDAVDRRTS
ncbi:hypothetical protein GFY24_00835 [Nocardia sp. SYP-A9097]|uniref:DUF6221 family protein n=1 Tax=Nocardia sp. SYP-A9097 TaxID=2663237 RepID=UPI00129BD5E3|nr:DUF6221 family protein [Nocardia sp. SYP-A9097]MRH86023.1 hypothetical protein [Nocardia sp. SYP-A9097]